MNENVTVFSHPLIKHKISQLRDETCKTKEFRALVEEISMLMGSGDGRNRDQDTDGDNHGTDY